MESNIEWTNKTWNPTTGCTKISKECDFCYAELQTNRFMKNPANKKYSKGFNVFVEHPETLEEPSLWKEPCTVFVNSMSDLFHKDVTLDFLKKVFQVMNETPRHTYQILTKRQDILAKYSDQLNWTDNIWMGVSAGTQIATRKIPSLVNCGALHKFLSIEPLIEEITDLNLDGIDWVILGGESGCNEVRPLEKEWVQKIQKQCIDQSVPFFFKQWGKSRNNPNSNDPTINKLHRYHAKGGCELDGKVHWANPTIKNNTMTSINLFGDDYLIMDEIDGLATIWELKSYLPFTEENLFENIKEDIKKNGQNDPILYITTPNGQKLVVDGHTRLVALISLKKKQIYTKELKETFDSLDEIKLWMTKNQLGRRNLSTLEKVKLAYNLKPTIQRLAKENLSKAGKANSKNIGEANTEEIIKIDTYAEIAKIAGVGKTTIVKYSQILAKASEPIKDQLNNGSITIGKAHASLKTEETTIENSGEKFISILPVRNNRQAVADRINNDYILKESTDESLKNKNELEKEEMLSVIKPEQQITVQIHNIIKLQNISDGEQKLLNGEIDVVMIFDKTDPLDILKENPNVRIGVYYL